MYRKRHAGICNYRHRLYRDKSIGIIIRWHYTNVRKRENVLGLT